MVRRYFFKSMHEKHYNRKWGKTMGGMNLDSTPRVPKDLVKESIDSLEASIDRLDKLIHEMAKTCPCRN
jgi:hypothetical protein